MNVKALIVNDYKKWLLYNFGNQGFESHYQLFKALKSGETFGAITLKRDEKEGLWHWTISHEAVDADLQIAEGHGAAILQYLVDNYFHNEDIDQLLVEKKQHSEKGKNHNYVTEKHYGKEEAGDYKIRQHPKESTYFNVKLAVSILMYLTFAALTIAAVVTDLSFLFVLAGVILIFLFFWLVEKIFMGIFIGIIRGNSIEVTKEQYPEVYEIIAAQARRLKMKELPEIYIQAGHFNAFVTKFSRAHILMIYSEVIETTLTGNYDVLKYVTAHELGHIKQKHLAKEKYLFPSKIVPFLSLAYSRGCEYTCDRIGFDFSPKGSIEGVLIMTTGKEIHSKFNIDTHIHNAVANEGFWTILSEKFLTHPHLYKRLVEIKKYSAYS
jgi:Zn-dependent protease with chaperone function